MSANKVSRGTPCHSVPSFDHRVTQCKSTVKVSAGRSRNAFQFHRFRTLFPSVIVNSHCSSGTCGVGPADKTGKSVVRYCPGGRFTSSARRRPVNPLEMAPMSSSLSKIKVGTHSLNIFEHGNVIYWALAYSRRLKGECG